MHKIGSKKCEIEGKWVSQKLTWRQRISGFYKEMGLSTGGCLAGREVVGIVKWKPWIWKSNSGNRIPVAGVCGWWKPYWQCCCGNCSSSNHYKNENRTLQLASLKYLDFCELKNDIRVLLEILKNESVLKDWGIPKSECEGATWLPFVSPPWSWLVTTIFYTIW